MPFGSTGTLFDTHANQIEEIINKNVDTILPTLDPAWRDTVVTSQGVGPASAIGRDLKILKIYRGGLTGVIEQAFPQSDFVLYGDATTNAGNKLYTQQATRTWPSALEGPVNRPYRLGIGMRAMLTNLAVTLGEMTAEATPAFIGDVIAPKLKGFAQNMAHTLCNYWYISQNSGYVLSHVSGLSAVTDAGSGTFRDSVTFTPGNGAVDRFYVGQRVDIYSATSNLITAASVRRNDSQTSLNLQVTQGSSSTRLRVFVSAVDELKGTVTLVGENGAFDTGGNLMANGDVIVYANSRQSGNSFSSASIQGFTGIAGINSWLKCGTGSGDNILLEGESDSSNQIDVTVHPEFKSFLQTSVGALTEHKLRQYIRRFHAAKNKYGQTIDCLIAADGVWLAYEAQKIGQYTLERTGRLSSLNNEGSEDGFKFTFEGKTYNGYTSTYIEDGVVYGLKKGGANWKRYVPPAPQGVQSFAEAESFIPFNFVMPALSGMSTTKWPILANNGASITEAVQMPGMIRMQLVPDQPAGLKLTGCSSDKVYSS